MNRGHWVLLNLAAYALVWAIAGHPVPMFSPTPVTDGVRLLLVYVTAVAVATALTTMLLVILPSVPIGVNQRQQLVSLQQLLRANALGLAAAMVTPCCVTLPSALLMNQQHFVLLQQAVVLLTIVVVSWVQHGYCQR